MGLRPRGKSKPRRPDPGKVPRNPASRRLPRLSRPYRKRDVVEPARREKEHRNVHHRIFRHVARIERQRLVLRSPGIALFRSRENRSRPGRRLQPTQGNDGKRSRTLARPKPQLRSVAAVKTLLFRWLAPDLTRESKSVA